MHHDVVLILQRYLTKIALMKLKNRHCLDSSQNGSYPMPKKSKAGRGILSGPATSEGRNL
jgi:hypothetical protein